MSMLNALSSASTEVAVVLAVDLPDGIGPTFTDQPWWPFALVLINSFLGLLAMVMFGLFFVGGSRVVASFAGNKSGSIGGGVAMMIASAIFIIFIFGGAATLNGWVDWLS